MNIGKKITSFRETKGYTVNKLANLAGVSQSYLREIELGNNTNPGIEVLDCICNALDITISELFNDNYQEKLINDPLFNKIYKLNAFQRKSLLMFLDSIIQN